MDDKEKAKRALVCTIGTICGIISIFAFDVDISMKILIPPAIMLAVTTLLFVIFCDVNYEIKKFNEKV